MANDVKKEKINLYKRIRAYVHAPNSMGNDAYPLYKRVDMTSEDEDGGDNISWINIAEKDSEWVSKIENNYGSPRNIRRLFIGANNFIVHFWEPIISNGKQGSERIIKKSSTKKLSVSEMLESGENEKYIIGPSKIGLDTLKDWSLKNLEEVYFDWTAVYTKQLKLNVNGQIQVIDMTNFIKQLYTKVNFNMKSNEVKQIFLDHCCRTNNIDKDYPRLKVVAFISNLDIMINNVSTAYNGVGKEGIGDLQLNWLDEAKKSYTDFFTKVSVVGFYGVNANRLYEKFSTSPNIYVFDSLLQDRFRRLAAEIDKFKRESVSKESNSSEEVIDDNKSNEKTTELEDAVNSYIAIMSSINGGNGRIGETLEGDDLTNYQYILERMIIEFGKEVVGVEIAKFSKTNGKKYKDASLELLGLNK